MLLLLPLDRSLLHHVLFMSLARTFKTLQLITPGLFSLKDLFNCDILCLTQDGRLPNSCPSAASAISASSSEKKGCSVRVESTEPFVGAELPLPAWAVFSFFPPLIYIFCHLPSKDHLFSIRIPQKTVLFGYLRSFGTKGT